MTTKEFAKKWFDTIDAKNYDQLSTMCADNHQFSNPVTPGALNRESHIEMIQGMMSAFEGGHQFEQTIAEGEWVVTRGRWIGKHTGEFNGIPATGKPVNFSFCDIMHVVNDK